MTTFFTADSHYGHAGIIQMCGRPYSDIIEHDRGLVDAWNAVVAPGDTVWHLGDFAYRGATLQLGWASIDQLTETVVDGQTIVLCHYALRVWRNMRRGALMLYGHSHGNLPATGRASTSAWTARATRL